MMKNNIVVVRGGGDIATGSIQKLHRAGFKVVVLECSKPTAIRRTVCLGEAVYSGKVQVEDLTAIKVNEFNEIEEAFQLGQIPVIVDEEGSCIGDIKPICVIDGILAKKNYGTCRKMAPITIALGPGFEAGTDVDIVVETMRGHNLGRLIFHGPAMKNTGVPGEIKGISKERVIYAQLDGILKGARKIGDVVIKGEIIAYIDEIPVFATIDGVLRGLIRDDFKVWDGLKIADIDPRKTEVNNCFTISDKARTIGGAVLEALMYKINEKGLN